MIRIRFLSDFLKKICFIKKIYAGLGENLPICKAQKIFKPERPRVREDLNILQQRRRWVKFRSNKIEGGNYGFRLDAQRQ